ncbi:MAG: 7TM diverse intracellular signaling domain-containing protein [Flavipsychrobacter sp.]|nr:7TM diverse intracellular signaling domain-containing protein [Flavipsychrobacter sp.]
MKFFFFAIVTFFCTILPFSGYCQSSDAQIVFQNSDGSQFINTGVYLFQDSTHSLTFDNIVHNPGFKLSPAAIPNLGVTTNTIWFRLTINNQSTIEKMMLEIDNPLLNNVSLYTQIGPNKYILKTVSKEASFYHRENSSENYLFTLEQKPGTAITYYLKINSYTQCIIPLKLGKIESINEADLNRDLLRAIYFGIMLVMFLYNCFVYISVKDKSYLYYIVYLLSVALVQLNLTGLGFKYIWPHYPGFEQFSTYLFSALTAFASIAFIRQFLNTKTFTPWLHKGFWLFVIAYAFTVINSLVGNKQLSYNLLNAIGLPLSLYMIYTAAVVRIKYKYKPALYFLLAWTIFLASIILFVLKDVGVLPYNIFTVSILQIGSAIEVVMLSIALADRINTLKREKEQSQAQAFEALKENEKIIREQNVVLEAKVTERTKELKESNDDLNQAITDLKEAEMQLVESEKMASLGQLTAGIAHEINNPINFVTSNVRPLKRDVQILFDTVEMIEKIGLDHFSAEEKIKQIEEYKQDIDFDYLKVEIDHLLNGIGEGATRTAEIVKGLRIFSRLDEDDLKKADINEGLDSTIIIINNLLNNRIEVVKNYGNMPLVECYPGKLNQVFLNMLTNAIYAVNKKFGDNAGGKLTITTSANEKNVIIKIADNGTGMDEQTKKKLFEPFFTTKDVGEGTGLGLSIAYNTINKHNGHIYVNSVINEGTEFIMEIPIHH